MELNTTILKSLSHKASNGCPIWGALTINEYLDPSDPIRMALWKRLSERFNPEIPASLISQLKDGAKANELAIDWRAWSESSTPKSTSRQLPSRFEVGYDLSQRVSRRAPARVRVVAVTSRRSAKRAVGAYER